MAKSKKIRAILKKVGEKPEIVMIDNTLEEMQRLVDGYIELVPLPQMEFRLAMVVNEEGRLRGLPFNCRLFGQGYVGDIMMVKTRGSGFTDVPEDFAGRMCELWELMGED